MSNRSQRRGRASPQRARLLDEVARAGRDAAAAAVAYHDAVAVKEGLSTTEEQALDLLERCGPLTAGQLAERSGLAPASVTGLVDRLQAKGCARRVPHPDDGRRVLIEIDPWRVARVHGLLADFIRSMDGLRAGYTDDQLETIAAYLTEAAALQRAAARKLTET